MSMSKKIILIINWNSIELSKNAIASTLTNLKNPYLIYLLDNNSDNFEGEKLKDYYQDEPKVKVFLSAENLGFAKGTNFLIKQAIKSEKTQYFLLLNNDAIASDDWSEKLISCAAETHSELVTSKIIQAANHNLLDNVGHLMLNTGEIIPIGHNEPEVSLNHRKKVIGACGGACLISAKLYQKIGGFDEHFFVGYEDAEYGLRAFLTGHDIYFEPKAIVYHQMGASIKKIFDYNYTLTQFRNINYTVLKLMPTSYLVINFPFYFIKTILVFVMNLVFFKKKFIKVMLHAYWKLFTTDFKVALKARKQFYQSQQVTRSLFEIQAATTFFLWFDIKRFWKFMILGKPNQFEKY
jgi:GT2 family glycosyltransferase